MKTSRRRSVRPLALAAVPLVLLAFGACGGGKGEVADLELPECDTYVATYKTCSTREGLPADFVDTRADAMRTDFRAAVKDATTRGEVRRRCETSARRLEEACR
jgi:hypothetical protein